MWVHGVGVAFSLDAWPHVLELLKGDSCVEWVADVVGAVGTVVATPHEGVINLCHRTNKVFAKAHSLAVGSFQRDADFSSNAGNAGACKQGKDEPPLEKHPVA